MLDYDHYDAGRETTEAAAGRAMDRMEDQHEKQLTTLRAALAVATARAEKVEADLNSHVGKQALKAWMKQAVDTAAERDQLRAQVARLREALETIKGVDETGRR